MGNKTKQQQLLHQIGEVQEKLRTVMKMSGMSGSEIDDVFAEPSSRATELCDQVIEHVPEFKTYKDFGVFEDNGKEDPYAQFGIFGRFLTEAIQASQEDGSLAKKAFNFINPAYNDVDDKFVRSMLTTEVLENLTISDKTISAARSHLEGEVLSQFEKMLSWVKGMAASDPSTNK